MIEQEHARREPAYRSFQPGFTMVELMVVVLIVSILAAIAIPSYTASVRTSRRVEARTAILDLAGREERYFNTAASYTNVSAYLGYGTTASVMTNYSVGSGYYAVSVYSPATAFDANGPAAPSYEIVATPLTAAQQKDTQCMLFTVDSTGKQTANTSSAGTGTDTTSTCWSQ